MSDLKEQLLKAGLITDAQARAATRPKSPPRPGKKAGKGSRRGPRPDRRTSETSAADIDLAQAYRLRASEERREREAAEQARREAERRRKANRDRIAQLIRDHLQNDAGAELNYHFNVRGKIKQVRVTPEQLGALAAGELAITFLDGRRCLIPAAVAEEIAALDPAKLVVRHEPDAGEADGVPDDLIW
jgi:hypothetical protein